MKAMKVTWKDSEECSSYEEKLQSETANMYYMAHSDSEVSDTESNSLLSYEELENVFEEPHNDFKKLVSKYNTIKNKHTCLLESYDSLNFDVEVYKSEIATLKNNLTYTTNENKILKQKSASSTSFVKPTTFKKGTIENTKRPKKNSVMHYIPYNARYTCHACNQIGHLKYDCPLKRNGLPSIKYIYMGS